MVHDACRGRRGILDDRFGRLGLSQHEPFLEAMFDALVVRGDDERGVVRVGLVDE